MTDTPIPASQTVDTVVRAFTEAELALADITTSIAQFRSASDQLEAADRLAQHEQRVAVDLADQVVPLEFGREALPGLAPFLAQAARDRRHRDLGAEHARQVERAMPAAALEHSQLVRLADWTSSTHLDPLGQTPPHP